MTNQLANGVDKLLALSVHPPYYASFIPLNMKEIPENKSHLSLVLLRLLEPDSHWQRPALPSI